MPPVLFALFFTQGLMIFAQASLRPQFYLCLPCNWDYRSVALVWQLIGWDEVSLTVCLGWQMVILPVSTSLIVGIIDMSLQTWPIMKL
jgi:hypothetical protein